jgi:CubicO group peptidase (beta-lactamase class C family)
MRILGSVLVMRGESVATQNSDGPADESTPNTAATRFQIASVSKQFTAAAVLLLAERGVLGLDDPMRRWIGGGLPSWAGITLRQLLVHTSGLPHWRAYDPDLDGVTPWPPAELIALFQSRELVHPPGSVWSYSSPAYRLLGEIVQRAADQPYADFLQREIFDRLGLTATFAGSPGDRPDVARGYWDGVEQPSLELDTVNLGAGDLWSTPGDLIGWTDALRAGRLLGPDSLDFMFTPRLEAEAGARYGCGWYHEMINGEPMLYHSGDNSGFKSFNAFLPESDRRLAILTNEFATDILAALMSLLAES